MVKGDADGVLAESLYFFDVCEAVFPVRPFSVLMVRVALVELAVEAEDDRTGCLLYTSPSPRDGLLSRMPSSA